MPEYQPLLTVLTGIVHVGAVWTALSLALGLVWVLVRAPGRAQRLALEGALDFAAWQTPNDQRSRDQLDLKRAA